MSEESKPKRQYHLSSKERAKRAAKRAQKTAEKKLEAQQKELKRAQNKVTKAREEIKRKARVAEELSGKLTDESASKLITGEEVKESPKAIKTILEDEETEVAFRPYPGPQTAFLASPELEVLYGGAAGGGKSYAMLMDPLRYAHNSNHRALLLRKSMPELEELINISRELYPRAFPGAKFNESKKTWRFPSGATLQFSFVDRDPDVYRFQGQAYTWIGIDEITHYPTPFVWDYLRSRLRRTDPSITPYMRCTANPGGVGGWWVKKMFIDPSEWNKPFWATDIETEKILRFPDYEQIEPELRGKPLFKRKFIPARLTDNPSLMQNPDYMANLSSLPETQRRRLLEGDWDVADDCAFPEFNHHVHVVDNFIPPSSWRRFKSCDYGYVAHSAVLWFAVDFDGHIYVYRELYQKGLDADALAQKIIEIENENEYTSIPGFLDAQCWEQRGNRGPSVAEVMIRDWGMRWTKCDKGPGSRLQGKLEIHRALASDIITKQPKLRITDACVNLIRTLPMLPLDEVNPEDIDKKFEEDHLYDALRYGLTSRATKPRQHPNVIAQFMDRRPNPVDDIFGY